MSAHPSQRANSRSPQKSPVIRIFHCSLTCRETRAVLDSSSPWTRLPVHAETLREAGRLRSEQMVCAPCRVKVATSLGLRREVASFASTRPQTGKHASQHASRGTSCMGKGVMSRSTIQLPSLLNSIFKEAEQRKKPDEAQNTMRKMKGVSNATGALARTQQLWRKARKRIVLVGIKGRYNGKKVVCREDESCESAARPLRTCACRQNHVAI